jgi:hypothetical protein
MVVVVAMGRKSVRRRSGCWDQNLQRWWEGYWEKKEAMPAGLSWSEEVG